MLFNKSVKKIVLAFGVATLFATSAAATTMVPLSYLQRGKDHYYFAPLKVYAASGQLSQSLKVEVDTGSSALILQGGANLCPNCHAIKGGNLPAQDFGLPQGTQLGGPFHYSYTNGAKLQGQLLDTKYGLGNLTPITSQAGVITSQKHSMGSTFILGMSPVTGNSVVPSFIQRLQEQDVISSFSFGLLACHGTGGSELVFNGLDPRVSTSARTTLPLVSPYYVMAQGMGVGGKSVSQEAYKVRIDSGKTGFSVPPSAYKNITRSLARAAHRQHLPIPKKFWRRHHDSVTLTEQQLTALPNINLYFAQGQSLVLTPNAYLIKHADGRYTFDMNANRHHYYVFGVQLLNEYYTEFDQANHELVFYSSQGLCG